MTSLRHRELGATLRQCCLSGQPAKVVIDHKEFEVSTKQISGEPHRRHRYGLCLYASDAMRGLSGSYQYATWEAANSERTGDMRIWDYSTTPPTDVTDADPDAKPEMVWWWLEWDAKIGFKPGLSGVQDKPRTYIGLTLDCGIINGASVKKQFPAGYTPTIHDLNEALAPYNVQVPVPEEAKRWCWDRTHSIWQEAVEQKEFAAVNEWHVWAWGTEADRDEKRDALLEAARKAGKP